MTTTPLYPDLPILLVDDEPAWLRSFGLSLRAAGITNISTCTDSRRVPSLLENHRFSVVVLDLIMPHLTGEELLAQLSANQFATPIIILTGLDQVETAVRCMRAGAYDFFTKVAEEERLISGIRRAIELGLLRMENLSLKSHFFEDELQHPEAFKEIITHDRTMLQLFRYMEAIAPSSEAVLLTGETGVGKELFALALHRLSGRKGKFVAVNVAGLDDTMFADNLFGHLRGAFTGAVTNRPGLIEQAAGGTLFLDEIGDLSQISQIKLLRLLQEREFHPLGSDHPRRTDAKLLFATPRDIRQLATAENFRKDLFYRLQTHHLHIPPLRARLGDLQILVDYFIQQSVEELGRKKPPYPKELLYLLGTYSFPGNVRELRTMLFNAVSSLRGRSLSLEPFKEYLRKIGPVSSDEAPSVVNEQETPFSAVDRLPTLKEAGRLLIAEALSRSQGNQAIAAEILGITRQALNWRLKQLDGDD